MNSTTSSRPPVDTEDGGVYAILPPGRLVPTKTRLFVDEVAGAIKAGWTR